MTSDQWLLIAMTIVPMSLLIVAFVVNSMIGRDEEKLD